MVVSVEAWSSAEIPLTAGLVKLEAGECSAAITTFGATLVRLTVFGTDVVLGHDDLHLYQHGSGGVRYVGATVGRVANRIGLSEFELEGTKYVLESNDGRNTLHGGNIGFGHRQWDLMDMYTDEKTGKATVEMELKSPDGEEGYPGEVVARVIYTLSPSAELEVVMNATATALTPINLAHHSYWNLGGHGSGDILDHEVQIRSTSYTVTDDELISTGDIQPVAGTPLDFHSTAMSIGSKISDPFLSKLGGYDHNFIVDLDLPPPAGASDHTDGDGVSLPFVARIRSPKTSIAMEVFSNMPGVQLYSMNRISPEEIKGKDGATYRQHNALCIETQYFPNSVKIAHFPSCIFSPQRPYHHRMIHRFSKSDGF